MNGILNYFNRQSPAFNPQGIMSFRQQMPMRPRPQKPQSVLPTFQPPFTGTLPDVTGGPMIPWLGNQNPATMQPQFRLPDMTGGTMLPRLR